MTNLIGQSLGRYHILEQLGEGGMAIVYKAYDTRLERDVAVKVIRTEKLTIETMGKTLKRFEREAKALAKLTHPNIVPITDYGEHDEKPYLVMPYLPGGTLKQKLGKPIPWEESVRLLIPIARALHYAHQQGIIHRDVKPSNILITQSGEPMLTDFGIAKILLDTEETADLTGTGMGVGTPEYMSPEQFQGKGVDARTDVYSLGVVLYEMVTGRKPYQADTPAAVLIKQVTEALPRPKSLVPELPDALEKALLKALAKNKEDRYHNLAEMAIALERLAGSTQQQESPLPKTQALPVPQKQQDDTFATIMQKEARTTQQYVAHEKPVEESSKTPWGWILIGITALVIGISIGISSFVQTQNMQAAATAQAYQAQATATEQARQLQAAATAQARMALINSWNLVLSDQFVGDTNGWTIGDIDDDLYKGSKSITDGKLIWKVEQSKGFVHWDWPTGFEHPTDFYVSVEIHRISGSTSSACYGLWFRGDGSDYYFYEACDDQTYRVSLHSEQDGWEILLGFETSSAIKPDQTNKLAVLAEGSHFEFYINDQLVNTLDNNRWSSGRVGIMIEMTEGDTATFEFDNFVLRNP